MTQTMPNLMNGSFTVHNRGYTCPACHSWELVPVVIGGVRRRFCASCASCWELHGDNAMRIDPVRCTGCGRQDACFDRLRHHIPLFTGGGAAID
jgi:hypothetical protein